MSLLDQIEARGISLEDLEKATAVRLFEKTAAAEGIDLNQLSENQVEDLFSHFTTPIHPTKEASTMNDEIVELFEKTAADEGIDLDDMSDEELAELYNHYVENVLPEQIEAADEYDKEASVLDAQEKLAEAEILGRHMARAYMTEIEKNAKTKEYKPAPYSYQGAQGGARRAQTAERAPLRSGPDTIGGRRLLEDKGRANATKNRLIELVTGKQERAAEVGKKMFGKEITDPAAVKRIERMAMAKSVGKRVGAAGLAGGLGYAGYRAMKKESSAEIEEQAYARAEEFVANGSIADYDGSFVDDVACDILVQHGYSW
jgi:hypothetical protein